MYQIQSDKLNYFEKEIKNPNRKIAYKFTLNGNDLPLNNIMDNPTLLTDLGLEQYSTGNVCVTSLQFSVKSEVALNYGDCITIHIGLYIYNDKTKKWEWLYSPMGSYYVDTIEEKGATKSIKAYDAMCKLNKLYVPSGNHNKTYDLALDIANQSGLELKGISQDTNNYDIDGSELGSYTLLGALSLLVGAIGNHVRINREGTALEFFDSVNHGLVFNESHYLAPAMDNQTSYNITSLVVKYGDDDKKQYTVGNGDKFSTLTIENPLLNNQQAQATNILSKIEQLNGYKRFDTTILLADFRIDPLDIITYQFKNEQYVVPILYLKTVLTHTGIKHELQSPTVANKPDGFDFKGSISKRLENTYTKEETENTILDKGYQTEMQVQQTVDALQLKFTQSGGYNLIRNSTGYLETNSWTTTATMGTANDNSIGGACDKYMYLDNGTTTSERFAYSSRFNLKPSTTYTLTGWFHNYTKCPSFDVFVLSSTSVDSSDTGTSYTNVHHLINVQNTNGTWKKYTVSFTTPDDCKSGIIRIDNNGFNANGSGSNRVHWSALVLSEGSLEVPWSPHPNEISDGIVTVDKDGIEVGKSNSSVTTRMTNDGFYVKRGSDTLLSATSSGLNVSGYATTSSLATANGTTINGANIRTGALTSQNGNLEFNLDSGRMHLYESGKLLSTIFNMKDNRTGTNGMGILTRTDSFIGLGIADNDDNTLYSPYIVLTGKDLGKEYKKGINIKETIHAHFCKASNLGLEWKDFARSRDDYATIYSTNQNSSNSKLIVEIGNDYTSSFEIHHKLYTNSSPTTVATFRATGGSENNSNDSAGINFYQNLNLHGHRIWGASTLSVEDIAVTNLSFETKASAFLADEDVTYTAPICLQPNMEHFGSAEMYEGSATVKLPLGFIHSGYAVIICPHENGNYRVEKSEDYFTVRGDIEKFDYIIKGVTAH